ncbi:hypothetical protein LXL04_017326 [Taraxacum kok-saghyz]
MGRAFNSKFYPASRISSQRNEICGIHQGTDETFHDYWERFNNLCTGCPQHQIPEQLLLQNFYEGLQYQEKRMIDASSGGDIFNKTPFDIRAHFASISQNQRNFRPRKDLKRSSTQGVNEFVTSNAHLESKILDLTNVVSQLVVGSGQQLMVCGVCAMTGHHTDMCPMVVGEQADVNALGGYQVNQDLPVFKIHTLLSFTSTTTNLYPQHSQPQYPTKQHYQHPQQNHYQQPQNYQNSGNSQMSLHDLVTSLATSQSQVQKVTRTAISTIQTQIGEMASSINKLESRGRLPSQTITNPRENVNMVTLMSVQEIEERWDAKTHIAHILSTYTPPPPFPQRFLSPKQMKELEEEAKLKVVTLKEKNVVSNENVDPPKETTITPLVMPPPFPSQLEDSKKKNEENEFLDIFRKIEINIPLLDAIKQIPKYAKFLKDICTNKRKLKGNEEVLMSENVSAFLQRKMPPKCKDPGFFTNPCKIGDDSITHAMLDLGASINVMPSSVYESLKAGPLNKTGVIIQIADKSNVIPRCVLEDVLVQVDKLVFPADFYVIDLNEHVYSKSSLVLLGRPFMKTAMTKIDVHAGTLTMEFDGEITNFSINDSKKLPSDETPLYFVDFVESSK